jgi:hypothetical protein
LRVTSLLGLLSLLAAYSCGASPQRTPTESALLSAMGEPLAQAATPSTPNQTPLHFYLDGSMSMQGFVSTRQGRFVRTLEDVLDRSVSAGYARSVAKFGQSVIPVQGSVSISALLTPSFYTEGETSFPTLFRHVDRNRKAGALTLIVSDLVQSGRSGEQRELSRSFLELAKRRPEVVLLARRSPFVGRYWPESTVGARSFDLDHRGIGTTNSRPFYLLAIGDSAVDLDLLRRYLGLETDEADNLFWDLDASRPAGIVSEAVFAPRPQAAESKVWQVKKRPEVLPVLGRSHRAVFWLFEKAPPPPAGAPVRFRLALDGALDVADPTRMTVEARRCKFVGLTPCQEPEKIEVPVTIELDGKGNLFASYSLPRPAAGSWEGYHLRLLPGRANLTRPKNVALWTTDDDSVPSNGTKTYKLDLFVDTLINALREPVPVAEQFVFLGRGE